MTQKSASFVGRGPRFNRICQGATEAWHSSWPAEMQPQSWQQKVVEVTFVKFSRTPAKRWKFHMFLFMFRLQSPIFKKHQSLVVTGSYIPPEKKDKRGWLSYMPDFFSANIHPTSAGR